MPDVFLSDNKKNISGKSIHKLPESNSGVNLPLFSAFCQYPQGIKLVNQENDEKIVLFLRRHFIKNINWISISITLLLLPIFLFLPINFFNTFQDFVPLRFNLIFLAFYYLIVFGFMLTNFITWFYNLGIITTKQIIDIDFNDIMYREVAKVRIQDIIDAEYQQGGFFHSFFNYGNVFVQTEGLKPNFEFHAIPNPDSTTDILIGLKGYA